MSFIKKALKYFLYFCLAVGILSAVFGKDGNNNVSTSKNVETPKSQQVQVQETQPVKEKEERQYQYVDVYTMMNDLQNNAAAAQRKYKDQYLAVTGQVEVIDSDGDYIALMADEYSIVGVRCDVKSRDKEQKDFVLNTYKGQTVTAYGKITDVGEVLGYSLKVDKFE